MFRKKNLFTKWIIPYIMYMVEYIYTIFTHTTEAQNQNEKPYFWAHLCLCTVGSYASLSVCVSVRCHFTRIHDYTPSKKKFTRKYFISQIASLWVSPYNLVHCKSLRHWQVGSLQRQVAFFSLMYVHHECFIYVFLFDSLLFHLFSILFSLFIFKMKNVLDRATERPGLPY